MILSTEDPSWCTIALVARARVEANDPDARRLASEVFLKGAGPALLRRVATILQPRAIPVMPVKGVLLQRLVYGEQTFRAIKDVDVLVPEDRFSEACAMLRQNGFTDQRWAVGRWQVTLRNPDGYPLDVDLHRRLTRTSRAGLTAAGMFERAKVDESLFGVPVVVPCHEDIFAHLLLHAALHWINRGTLHRPEDFEAVGRALALDPDRCVSHLARHGLLAHARLVLPFVDASTGGTFVRSLLHSLPSQPRARASAWLVRSLTARYPRPGSVARRFAGMILAPSISSAITSAIRDRIARAASPSA